MINMISFNNFDKFESEANRLSDAENEAMKNDFTALLGGYPAGPNTDQQSAPDADEPIFAAKETSNRAMASSPDIVAVKADWEQSGENRNTTIDFGNENQLWNQNPKEGQEMKLEAEPAAKPIPNAAETGGEFQSTPPIENETPVDPLRTKSQDLYQGLAQEPVREHRGQRRFDPKMGKPDEDPHTPPVIKFDDRQTGLRFNINKANFLEVPGPENAVRIASDADQNQLLEVNVQDQFVNAKGQSQITDVKGQNQIVDVKGQNQIVDVRDVEILSVGIPGRNIEPANRQIKSLDDVPVLEIPDIEISSAAKTIDWNTLIDKKPVGVAEDLNVGIEYSPAADTELKHLNDSLAKFFDKKIPARDSDLRFDQAFPKTQDSAKSGQMANPATGWNKNLTAAISEIRNGSLLSSDYQTNKTSPDIDSPLEKSALETQPKINTGYEHISENTETDPVEFGFQSNPAVTNGQVKAVSAEESIGVIETDNFKQVNLSGISKQDIETNDLSRPEMNVEIPLTPTVKTTDVPEGKAIPDVSVLDPKSAAPSTVTPANGFTRLISRIARIFRDDSSATTVEPSVSNRTEPSPLPESDFEPAKVQFTNDSPEFTAEKRNQKTSVLNGADSVKIGIPSVNESAGTLESQVKTGSESLIGNPISKSAVTQLSAKPLLNERPIPKPDSPILQAGHGVNTGLEKAFESSLIESESYAVSEVSVFDDQMVFDQVEIKLMEIAGLAQAKDEKQVLKMRLNPAELGEVEIMIELDQSGKICAHFRTSSEAARSIIFESLGQLRDSMQNSGLIVESLEVSSDSRLSNGNNSRDDQARENETVRNGNTEISDYDQNPDGDGVTPDNSVQRLVNLRA